MPLMGIMYPRSEKGNLDNNYEDLKRDEPEEYAALVRHSARVGVDLGGADLIKNTVHRIGQHIPKRHRKLRSSSSHHRRRAVD